MNRFVLSATLACLALAVVRPASAQKNKDAPRPKIVDVDVKSDEIVYRKTPEGELKMHVYYPSDWKKSDRRPVIVFFFGGGWKGGTHLQFMPQSQYFATRGLVCCCADYRILSIHKTTPDQCVVDAKAAIRWVRSHASDLGIDPDKVIAAGGSAGGHLAACTALVPGLDAKEDDTKVSCVPNALLLYNPALNLKDREVLNAEKKDVAKEISPTLYLTAKPPPALILFGTNDTLLAQGEEYHKKAKELGVRTELATAEGEKHGFFNRPPWLEVTTRRADEYLQSLNYLKGPATVKLPAGAGSLK